MYYAEYKSASCINEYFVDARAVICYYDGSRRVRIEIKNRAVEVSVEQGRLSVTRTSPQKIRVRKETA